MAEQKSDAGGQALYVATMILGALTSLAGVALLGVGCYLAEQRGGSYIPGCLPYLLFFGGGSIMTAAEAGLRRRTHVKALKKTRAYDWVQVYQEMDEHSPLVATLEAGTEVRILSTVESGGITWVKLALLDGSEGFVFGSTRVVSLLIGVVTRETPIYEFEDSPPAGVLATGTEVEVNEAQWDAPRDRVMLIEAWLPDGRKAFMKSSASFKWVTEDAKKELPLESGGITEDGAGR